MPHHSLSVILQNISMRPSYFLNYIHFINIFVNKTSKQICNTLHDGNKQKNKNTDIW